MELVINVTAKRAVIMMSHRSVGEFQCTNCYAYVTNPRMQDISDDDIYGSLVWCKECEKWVRWV